MYGDAVSNEFFKPLGEFVKPDLVLLDLVAFRDYRQRILSYALTASANDGNGDFWTSKCFADEVLQTVKRSCRQQRPLWSLAHLHMLESSEDLCVHTRLQIDLMLGIWVALEQELDPGRRFAIFVVPQTAGCRGCGE